MRLKGYEVGRVIGRGGMGEVFEATRVGPAGFRKPVAIKRLPSERSIDRASVQRFLQEARISAQLDHPNIVRIHDLVVDEGYFLVMELLRGWDLGEAIANDPNAEAARSWRTALEVADQALAGLAYAHSLGGLVHRDLTPRNLFLTETGVVKLLDFGLAKLVGALTPGLTEAGHLHGTLSFLAPEQARGEASDPKTDLYQLGGIVYWMLSAQAPNGAGSAHELLVRAVNQRPTPLGELRSDLPAPVLALVERAMAFDAAERFGEAAEMRAAVQAALRDGGERFGLGDLIALLPRVAPPAVSDAIDAIDAIDPFSRATATRDQRVLPPPDPRARRSAPARALALVLAAAGAAAMGYAGSASLRSEPVTTAGTAAHPIYRRLTFRPGYVLAARFAPGGRSVVYSGSWGGDPIATTATDLDHPEHPAELDGRALEIEGSEVVGVAPDGRLALLRGASFIFSFVRMGTLMEASLGGDDLREKSAGVQDAEWMPDGAQIVLRWNGARTTLEKASGEILLDAGESTWFDSLRVSREGRIALSEHPIRHDDRGRIVLYDPEQRKTVPLMDADFSTLRGMAWGPGGREVWFTGEHQGASRALYAVTLEGDVRLIDQVPGSLYLYDVDDDGRSLLAHEVSGNHVYLDGPDAEERDISWFDFDAVFDIAADGSKYIFLQGATDASGQRFLSYLRQTNGSPAVEIAEGLPVAMSPDGSRVLVIDEARAQLQIVPTGAGEPFTVTTSIGAGSAAWFPDGRRVLIGATSGDGAALLDTETRRITTLPSRGLVLPILGNPIAPDGLRFAAIQAETNRLIVTDLEGGPRRLVENARPGEQVLRWTPDGKALLVAQLGNAPLVISRLDLATGARTHWRSLTPSDATNVIGVVTAALTADLGWSVYSATYMRSTLYLVEELR